MNAEEKLKDKVARMKIIKTWPRRMKKLLKEKAMPQRTFFDKYGMTHSHVSKLLNGHALAEWPLIRKMEAALEAEGV